jgi:HEAT repeat protein
MDFTATIPEIKIANHSVRAQGLAPLQIHILSSRNRLSSIVRLFVSFLNAMSLEAFFQQLKHPNPHLRDQAMWDIAEHRDETTVPRLMAILDEKDTTYRRAAVKALGVIGPDTVPPLVDALLNSSNVTVRGSAAKALAQVVINYPEVPLSNEGMQGLKTALSDPNPVVHIAAVMALGEWRPCKQAITQPWAYPSSMHSVPLATRAG